MDERISVRFDISRQTCSDWNRYHGYHTVYGNRLVRITYSLDRPPTNSPSSLRPQIYQCPNGQYYRHI
ncbi:unnamed protein product [Alternaria burnsii]|nr:unnamed protein product [Alternaria burnsii]